MYPECSQLLMTREGKMREELWKILRSHYLPQAGKGNGPPWAFCGEETGTLSV